MLSAVETFGPASAVVQHPYGQIHLGHHPSMHNPFAGHTRSSGLFLPPPIPQHTPSSSPSSVVTTSTSLPIQIPSSAAAASAKESNTQLSLSRNGTPPQDTSMSTLVTTNTTTITRSPTLCSPSSSTSSCSSSSSSTPTTPSSTAVEFARPMPKQPRYSNGNDPSSQYSPRKYTCSNNNNHTSINHNHNQTKYAVVEQSGPVNLVTSNNSNSHTDDDHSSSKEAMASIDDPVALTGLYAQKLPFAVTIPSGHPPPPSAAYHSYMYANRTIAAYGQQPLYARSPIPNRLIYLHDPTYAPYMTTQLNPSQHSHSSHSLPPTPTEISPPPPLLLHPPQAPPTQQQQQAPSLDRSRNPATATNLQMGNMSNSGSIEIMNGNGTYLNGKVNNQLPTDTTSGGFKVPSGKDGSHLSLKHRILTNSNNTSRPNNATDVRKSSTKSNYSNFFKGAVIELANGGLRRVEDIRTEDFIHSAEKSPYHIADSTIVKITKTSSDTIIITFSYCKNQSKADVEVTEEHPFFVYGNGWASYNPDLSMESFGLKCQKLQVGDVCISLTLRETPPPGNYEVPQNLSKKGLPTTASGSLFFSNKRTYSGNNTQKHWNNPEQEIEPVDVSLRRKRKWSDSDFCTNSSS